jgi:tetratricopeptide (TPR) repeat protein
MAALVARRKEEPAVSLPGQSLISGVPLFLVLATALTATAVAGFSRDTSGIVAPGIVVLSGLGLAAVTAVINVTVGWRKPGETAGYWRWLYPAATGLLAVLALALFAGAVIVVSILASGSIERARRTFDPGIIQEMQAFPVLALCAVLLGLLGVALSLPRPRASLVAWNWRNLVAFVAACPIYVLVILGVVVLMRASVRPIQADVVYKLAVPFDYVGEWESASSVHEIAIELAPDQDFYYLYLGRAYLERASSSDDPVQRDSMLEETERVLLEAQALNPLNTDHSANLARLYRRWATLVSDTETRESLFQRASDNYAAATTLGPQNVILWNEWASLYYYNLGDVESFERTLQRSLDLDTEFEQTWWLCGDVNRQLDELDKAAHCYEEIVRLTPDDSRAWRVLGDTYITMQQWEDAITVLTHIVEHESHASDLWKMHQVLAQLYAQVDRLDEALTHAHTALQLAPEDQRPQIEQLIQQLQ